MTHPHPLHQQTAQAGLGVVLGLVAALLVGCAGAPGTGGGSGSTGSTGSTDPPTSTGGSGYDVATGTADILVSIDVSGGLVPSDLRDIADFTLVGDGTAIAAAAVDASFPGPAIQPLQSELLEESQIQELLALADLNGLLVDGIDFGEPTLQDLPYTTVSLTVSGRTVTHSVYALGFNDDVDADLNEDQRAARRGLRDVIEAAQATVASDASSYAPSGVVAYRLAIESTLGDPTSEQVPVPWPIATLPPPIGSNSPISCLTVSGADADVLLDVLADANESTPWLIGPGPPTQMIFRPQLPGDPGCS